jgi:hypothetical protein
MSMEDIRHGHDSIVQLVLFPGFNLSFSSSVISCRLCSYDDDFNPGGATTEHGRLSRFPADFAAFG